MKLFTNARMFPLPSCGRWIRASILSTILLVFPPWTGTFHPTAGLFSDRITIALPWPNPSFSLSGFRWSSQHEFATFVSILTPPRPRAESLDDHVVGVWTTALDVPRLIAMMLVLIAVGGLVPILVELRSAKSLSTTRVARALEARMNVEPSSVVREADLLGVVDLDNPAHVELVERIREAYSGLLADESRPHARCMFRSVDELPYPKEIIRRAMLALLEYCRGVRGSRLLDVRLRNPEIVAALQTAIVMLDSFLEVPLTELPTDPAGNVRLAAQVFARRADTLSDNPVGGVS